MLNLITLDNNAGEDAGKLYNILRQLYKSSYATVWKQYLRNHCNKNLFLDDIPNHKSCRDSAGFCFKGSRETWSQIMVCFKLCGNRLGRCPNLWQSPPAQWVVNKENVFSVLVWMHESYEPGHITQHHVSNLINALVAERVSAARFWDITVGFLRRLDTVVCLHIHILFINYSRSMLCQHWSNTETTVTHIFKILRVYLYNI